MSETSLHKAKEKQTIWYVNEVNDEYLEHDKISHLCYMCSRDSKLKNWKIESLSITKWLLVRLVLFYRIEIYLRKYISHWKRSYYNIFLLDPEVWISD